MFRRSPWQGFAHAPREPQGAAHVPGEVIVSEQNRTRRFEARFTEDEFHVIETAARMLGKTLSEYVRDRCVNDDASIITILHDHHEIMRREREKAKRRPRMDDFAPTFVHTRRSEFEDIEPIVEGDESLSKRVIVEPMRRRGAPKLNRVSIRVTDYEWKALHYRAHLCRTTLTRYILAKAVYEQNGFGTTDISVSRDELRQICDELRRQGANLNQIARGVNVLNQLQQRDDVDGEIIDHLMRNIKEDNEQTRALINDALTRVYDALALTGFRRK